MSEFLLSQAHLQADLDALAAIDADIATALASVGYPQERRNKTGFAIFLGIIVSQQLSTKAAATIKGRLFEKMNEIPTPQGFLVLEDDELRAAGLSRPKIRYGRGLCEAVLEGRFDPDALGTMRDDEVIEAITALLGFGRWSAEMYLLFSLGRPDVWPADDLAVQEAVKRIKGLDARPKQKEMDVVAAPWRPYRGAAAIFLWHYYARTPNL